MRLDYATENANPAAAPAARFGVVLLQTDEIVETEFPRLLGQSIQPMDGPANLGSGGIRVHYSRVPSGREVTTESLTAMAAALPVAVDLLPPAVLFDVIAYACTSGATIIGEAQVAEAVRSVRPGVAVSNPLTAAKAALRSLGARRIGFLTPYVAEVSSAMRDNLTASGCDIVSFGSFEVADDGVVASMTPQCILQAAVEVGGGDCDAVFIACTNLRAAGIIERAEAALGKPVISSNQALAWHMLRLAGIDAPRPGCGRLFDCGLA
jgi:maleate isomerase